MRASLMPAPAARRGVDRLAGFHDDLATVPSLGRPLRFPFSWPRSQEDLTFFTLACATLTATTVPGMGAATTSPLTGAAEGAGETAGAAGAVYRGSGTRCGGTRRGSRVCIREDRLALLDDNP
jgi:hypothetical protein